MIRGLFSDRVHSVQRAELASAKALAPARVEWLNVTSLPLATEMESFTLELIEKRKQRNRWLFRSEESANEQLRQCTWQSVERFGLRQNTVRNSLIALAASEAVSQGRHVLILLKEVAHAEEMAAQIDGAAPCHARLGRKRREATINEFRSGSIPCLAVTSLLDEGFDAPIADTIVMGIAGKSYRKAVQASGRVLRYRNGKDFGLIIDFWDLFHPMLRAQSLRRRAVYDSLGYSQTDPFTRPQTLHLHASREAMKLHQD